MNEINLHMEGGQAQDRKVPEAISRIKALTGLAGEISENANYIGDALFGAEPKSSNEKSEGFSACGEIDDLFACIQVLESRLLELRSGVSRLARL